MNDNLKNMSSDFAKTNKENKENKEKEYDSFKQCVNKYNRELKVFVINGSGGSGKDISWIKNYCLNKGISCKSILIKRPNTIKKGNHADDNVEQYINYDYTILNKGTLEDFKKKAQDFFEYNIEEYQPVCTTATDSEDVAHGLKNFEYNPEKTKEILAKYDGLLDKYNALLKEKNELVIKCQANYEKQKREEKERIAQAKRAYENMPQWKKDALDNWTENLKKSCTYWEDREY